MILSFDFLLHLYIETTPVFIYPIIVQFFSKFLGWI